MILSKFSYLDRMKKQYLRKANFVLKVFIFLLVLYNYYIILKNQLQINKFEKIKKLFIKKDDMSRLSSIKFKNERNDKFINETIKNKIH